MRGIDVDILSIAKVLISDNFCVFFNITLSTSNDCLETVVVKRNINNEAIDRLRFSLDTVAPAQIKKGNSFENHHGKLQQFVS